MQEAILDSTEESKCTLTIMHVAAALIGHVLLKILEHICIATF